MELYVIGIIVTVVGVLLALLNIGVMGSNILNLDGDGPEKLGAGMLRHVLCVGVVVVGVALFVIGLVEKLT